LRIAIKSTRTYCVRVGRQGIAYGLKLLLR
jgi:hypothetical protein